MNLSNRLALVLSMSAVSVVLTACNEESGKAAAIPAAQPAKMEQVVDHDHVCETKTLFPAQTGSACIPGQKVVFLPPTFGNEQLPIFFAALNCDLRYQVVHSRGAVTCIYHPARPGEKKAEVQSPSNPAQEPSK